MNALQESSPGRLARKERLAAQFTPLVRRLVRQVLKISPWHPDYDDAVGAGMLAVCRAADKFDHVRGPKFCTYAWKVVVRALLEFSERWRGCGFTGFGGRDPEAVFRVEREWMAMHGVVDRDSDADAVAREDDRAHARELIEAAVQFLPERERRVLTMRYWEGQGFREIAEALGVTKQRVQQIQNNALLSLRRRLAGVGEEQA